MGVGGGRGGRQQALFPVQVMMPVGPQGAWQPVQYMMTAQQVHAPSPLHSLLPTMCHSLPNAGGSAGASILQFSAIQPGSPRWRSCASGARAQPSAGTVPSLISCSLFSVHSPPTTRSTTYFFHERLFYWQPPLCHRHTTRLVACLPLSLSLLLPSYQLPFGGNGLGWWLITLSPLALSQYYQSYDNADV
jgi:hypothetical protein